jgi:hypothetical protein
MVNRNSFQRDRGPAKNARSGSIKSFFLVVIMTKIKIGEAE